MRLRVSPRLRVEFGNGDEFYAHEGEPIWLPERRSERPAHGFLQMAPGHRVPGLLVSKHRQDGRTR